MLDFTEICAPEVENFMKILVRKLNSTENVLRDGILNRIRQMCDYKCTRMTKLIKKKKTNGLN